MDLDPEKTHVFLKSMFLRVEESSGTYRYKRVLSTTELSQEAYQEYWKRVQRWASLPTLQGGLSFDSGLDLYIPDPNEVDYDNY